MSLAYSLPVDWNGDGRHELVYFGGSFAGRVLDADGRLLDRLEGRPVWAAKVVDLPGEQVLCWTPDGRVLLFASESAKDSDLAGARYAMPEYARWMRMFGMGYSAYLLGGL